MNLSIKFPLLAALLAPALLLTACERPDGPAGEADVASEKTAASPECVRTPPAEPVVCTMEWRPVCGCDGITYPNACSAGAAGISAFEEGECEADRPE